MIPGEIFRATKRFEDRKDAIGASADRSVDNDQMRILLSGLDLDFEEVREVVTLVVRSALGHANDTNAVETISGTWLDGLVTGLLLAEDREKTDV